jgi:hypothetical protein
VIRKEKPKSKKKEPKKSKSKMILSVLLAVSLIFGGYFFVRYMQINDKYKDVTMTQEERNNQTVKAVSKLMDLPKDETPIIYAVKDKDKLGTSNVTKQYFEKAVNGDVILAYQKSNISIIYRPSEKRIIKTDNYNNFLAAANPIKIVIIAPNEQQQDTENLVNSKVLNIEIVKKEQPKTSITSSFVADLTGQNAKAAKELADKIGLPVGQYPMGETKPEGAILALVIANTIQPATQ